MKLLHRIKRSLSLRRNVHDSAPVIDYVGALGGSGEWRDRKLAEAALRHGRPFKCAADDLPHETLGSRFGIADRD